MDSEFTLGTDAAEYDAAPFHNMQLLHESKEGHCRVFLCEHYGRKVVVKALREKYRDSEVYRRMLRKEFTIAASMTHENIVSALFFNEVPGFGLCIVMEYFDGVTLTEYMHRHPHLRRGEALALLQQICSAVDYIHSRRIVHRDLKPGNILVTSDGRYVKIIDFGLSHGPAFLQFDLPGGTPGYIAPEVMETSVGAESGFNVDIYSLGSIICKLGCGHEAMAAVGRRCLAESPQSRPKSAALIVPMIRRRYRVRRWLAAGIAAGLAVVSAVLMLAPEGARKASGRGEMNKARMEQAADVPSAEVDSMAEPVAAQAAAANPGVVTAMPEMPATTVSNDNEAAPADDSSLPLEEQVYRYAKVVAAQRFAEHLHMWDTLTTTRSMELCMVKHWRWKAREDVRRWLATRIDAHSPYMDDLMEIAAKTVVRYGDEHQGEEYAVAQRAARRTPKATGATLRWTENLGDGKFKTCWLQEDGTWAYKIEDVRSKWIRTHPDATTFPDFDTMWPDDEEQ